MPNHGMAAASEVAVAIPFTRSWMPRGDAIYVLMAPTMQSMRRLQELREDAAAAGMSVGEYVKSKRALDSPASS